jgi:tetratricopeptide (TPR) repeat protein
LYLRGRVAEQAGRHDEAIAKFTSAARSSRDPSVVLEAAWHGAVLLRDRNELAKALSLLAGSLQSPGGFQVPADTPADVLMLLGDLAYELGRAKRARASYISFMELFPDDPRGSAVRYRLTRLGTTIPPGPEKDKDATPDCWLQAAQFLRAEPGPR